LADRFDIDFVALTFTQDGSDVRAAREALAEVGALETKILAKACEMLICFALMTGHMQHAVYDVGMQSGNCATLAADDQ